MADNQTLPPLGVDMESGKFVRKGFLLKDLLASLSAETPTPNAETVRDQLTIRQECDFRQQLLTGFAATGEFSLAAYIRRYVRNNSGDVTELPSMERFFVNPNSQARNTSALMVERLTDTDTPHLVFATKVSPADYLATKTNPWTQNNGVFTFSRKATIQLNLVFNTTLRVGNRTSQEIEWRFSDSQNNRAVTLTPIVTIEGTLSSGLKQVLSLPAGMFFAEHYDRQTTVPIRASLRLNVLDAAATFGRIEKLTVTMQRSSWVARDSTTVYDTVRYNKQTDAGVLDTCNYVELIEV